MNTGAAPRSIEQYLRALREALAGEDPALIQDALYDAEEYLRAEVRTNPGKSEADVLEVRREAAGRPEGVEPRAFDLSLTIREGRTREVRRLCDAVGLEVLRLVRTSFGPVRLGALAPGASRPLTAKERDLLLALTHAGTDR